MLAVETIEQGEIIVAAVGSNGLTIRQDRLHSAGSFHEGADCLTEEGIVLNLDRPISDSMQQFNESFRHFLLFAVDLFQGFFAVLVNEPKSSKIHLNQIIPCANLGFMQQTDLQRIFSIWTSINHAAGIQHLSL